MKQNDILLFNRRMSQLARPTLNEFSISNDALLITNMNSPGFLPPATIETKDNPGTKRWFNPGKYHCEDNFKKPHIAQTKKRMLARRARK
jgi:hypothetical protein